MQGLYPLYHSDLFVEISDEVTAALVEAECIERNYIRRVHWNKAYFSLDAGDSIEYEALFVALSPCELYERKVTAQELRVVLNVLPDTQDRRVYAHYVLGLSRTEIAWTEGTVKSRVSGSTERRPRNMEKFLENTFWQAGQSFGESHGY